MNKIKLPRIVYKDEGYKGSFVGIDAIEPLKVERNAQGFFITREQAEQIVDALKCAVQLICGDFCSDVNRHSWHEAQDKALAIFLGEEKK
jgi:hypothetical protein